MKTTLSQHDLSSYVAQQLHYMFPDAAVAPYCLNENVGRALERLDFCFSHARIKYFVDGQQTRFNHRNTDQYAMFLYFLSNSIFRSGGDLALAEKTYALNKALHGIDVFYEVQLPDIFLFQHPVGTVLGRATYSNYLFVYQRCSVGSNLDGQYPRFGEGVVMFGGSTVIGNCAIGDNCWLSVGATIMDCDIASGSVVFGRTPNHVVKRTRRNVKREIFAGQSRAKSEAA
jgi:serine O-acetyltransferase